MKTWARSLTLAVSSGITAEFLLGDQYLHGIAPVAQQVSMLVMFTLFYGSAAVIIREVARRTGRGWPTILLLALAYGIFEEGVVDQSLFNPNFAGERLLDFGHIPIVGTAGPWLVFVLTLHVIWSISAPIAIAEALFPEPLPGKDPVGEQRQGPWLGRLGLGVAIACFTIGATAIFLFSTVLGGFMASPLQLVMSVLVAAGCVVLALRMRRAQPVAPKSPWPGLLLGFVATTAFQLINRWSESWSPWLAVAALLLVLAAGFWLVHRLRPDVFGLAAGAILTYAWLGWLKTPPLGAVAMIEQSVIVLIGLGVLLLALRRHPAGTQKSEKTSLQYRT